MAQEKNKKKAENAAEGSSKPSSSEKKTPKSLKPEPKIMKKLLTKNFITTKKGKGTPQGTGKKGKNRRKSVPQGNQGSNANEREGAEKLSTREGNKEKNITDEKHIEKSQQNRKNKGKLDRLEKYQQNQKNEDKLSGMDKSLQNEKNKGKLGWLERNQENENRGKRGRLERSHENEKNKGKHGRLERSQENENRGKRRLERSQENEKNKGKHGRLERSQENEKKQDKLGGLIFMCNAKTKPDCFRYGVMGLPLTKKDLVLGVRPGLKLFLYDFDLKLMYGIYKASSSGGMKLEPTAFGGAFPVQVRFNVHKDCYPLPESVFKKAIKENYNERHKFRTELTLRQVKKLSELFRPAGVLSNAPSILSPPIATIRDREIYEEPRESWHHSHRERYARNPYTNGDTSSYPVPSHEIDQPITFREVASVANEEYPHESFLTERDYRTYGLRGERRKLTPPGHIAPTLEPYQRDPEREYLLRHPAPMYRDTAPAQIESVRHDPILLNEKEYRTYGLGIRRELQSAIPPATATTASALDSYPNDSYYANSYGVTSADPYPSSLRRKEASSGSYSVAGRRDTYLAESDHLRRRETNQVERLYSTYASNALSEYSQRDHNQGTGPEPTLAPVSSRYSFAGPSTYR